MVEKVNKRLSLSFAVLIFSILHMSSSKAGDFDVVRRAQENITIQKNTADVLKKQSDDLKKESTAIRTTLFYAFYDQAKKGGVIFEKISPDPVQWRDGLGRSEVTYLSGNQEFAVIKSCGFLSGCDVDPTVKILNFGERSLSINFDDPNITQPCGDGTVSLSCRCRLSAFTGYLSLPCSEFFDENKRPALSKAVMSWLKKTLLSSMNTQ